eukprot:2410638-Pyramimonas_sp.AAC.1
MHCVALLRIAQFIGAAMRALQCAALPLTAGFSTGSCRGGGGCGGGSDGAEVDEGGQETRGP